MANFMIQASTNRNEVYEGPHNMSISFRKVQNCHGLGIRIVMLILCSHGLKKFESVRRKRRSGF